MTFSSLADAFDQPQNRLYAARDALLKSGRKILDLVSGNVNAHGIAYPASALQRMVKTAIGKTAHYRPDPQGQCGAREAIAGFYKGEGVRIPASQFILTPGTSLSYWYCFKLLADAGDEILCPSPSYPLFESIAALARITLIPYRLLEGDRWVIDLDELEGKVTPRTKAIVLISPHNPTGSVATLDEVRGIGEIAARHGLSVIHDEVFSPFVFNQKVLPRPVGSQAPLVLTLNGFSKMFALAGTKIGWIGVTGDSARVTRALKALDMISDTFLPVNEWAQAVVPFVFKEGGPFLAGYRRSMARRADVAVDFVKSCDGLSTIRPEGGFFMTVRLNHAKLEEEAFAVGLLNQERILVHPGYFYDMSGRHFIITTVARPLEMRQALARIRHYLNSLR